MAKVVYDSQRDDINIKREVCCYNCDDDSYKGQWKGVLIGLRNQRIRIRYPKYTLSKVQYVDEASNDLKILALLWIGRLVSSGVLADKLEEECPQHAEAAQILRTFEQYSAELGNE
jgi:hypothetical protein